MTSARSATLAAPRTYTNSTALRNEPSYHHGERRLGQYFIEVSAAPIRFWPHLAEHAIDCLNRTTGPPGSALSSFEALTGAKPKIMSIMPFGCTAYAMKPREALAIRSSLPGGGATLRPPTLLGGGV